MSRDTLTEYIGEMRVIAGKEIWVCFFKADSMIVLWVFILQCFDQIRGTVIQFCGPLWHKEGGFVTFQHLITRIERLQELLTVCRWLGPRQPHVILGVATTSVSRTIIRKSLSAQPRSNDKSP